MAHQSTGPSRGSSVRCGRWARRPQPRCRMTSTTWRWRVYARWNNVPAPALAYSAWAFLCPVHYPSTAERRRARDRDRSDSTRLPRPTAVVATGRCGGGRVCWGRATRGLGEGRRLSEANVLRCSGTSQGPRRSSTTTALRRHRTRKALRGAPAAPSARSDSRPPPALRQRCVEPQFQAVCAHRTLHTAGGGYLPTTIAAVTIAAESPQTMPARLWSVPCRLALYRARVLRTRARSAYSAAPQAANRPLPRD